MVAAYEAAVGSRGLMHKGACVWCSHHMGQKAAWLVKQKFCRPLREDPAKPLDRRRLLQASVNLRRFTDGDAPDKQLAGSSQDETEPERTATAEDAWKQTLRI